MTSVWLVEAGADTSIGLGEGCQGCHGPARPCLNGSLWRAKKGFRAEGRGCIRMSKIPEKEGDLS